MTPSRLAARGLRVGRDWFERGGMSVEGAPRGLVDSIADLAHPHADTSRMHPAVVPFFERTAELELLVEPRWRWKPLGALVHVLTGAIEQLQYPVSASIVDTRLLALDAAADGRRGARGVVRTVRESQATMHVAAYAVARHEDFSFMSVAFPVPLANLFGLLRLDTVDEEDGLFAAELSTARRFGRSDRAGVWLATRLGCIPVPFSEQLRLWPAGARAAPPELDASRLPGATIVGQHEQRFFGVRYVTHLYWMRPR